MTKQELINLINSVIKQNGNEEITGQILNAVLLAMVGQSNDLIGDFNNTTITGNTIIDKINSLSGLIENASGIKLHSGPNDPNVTPPASYNVADFYAQTIGGVVTDLYQYNGVDWVNQQNVINDNNISVSTTYSSEKINQLLTTQDGVINVTSITVAGNLVTIGAGSQWRISGVTYSNTNDVTITVPYAAVGYVRLDNLLGNTSNTFELQQGTPTTGIAVAPLKPANKVVITQISVNEDSVNSNVNNAKLKAEGGYIDFNSVGAMPNINITSEASNINITNASSIGSLNIDSNFVYAGKKYTVTNKRTVDVTILNNGGDGNAKFIFPNNTNYVLKPNETIEFFLSSDLTRLNFLGSNMASASGGHKVVLLDVNADGSVYTQGVTGTVGLKTYQIPIDKIKSNGIFRISVRMMKTEGVEATFTTNVWFGSTSNSFPLNSMASTNATNKYVSGIREVKSIYNQSSNDFTMRSFITSGNYYTSWMAAANLPTEATITPTMGNLTVRLTVNTTSTNDKIVLDYLLIEYLEA